MSITSTAPDRPPAPAFLHELPLARRAWDYTLRVHGAQTRASDGAPFVEHPREVAELLYDSGSTEPLVAAGLLHDTIERTLTTLRDLGEEFGSEVAALVAAVTEDEAIRSYARRKAALREQVAMAGGPAGELFAADKVSKVREYRVQLAQVALGGAAPRARRLLHYRSSYEMLGRMLPAHPLVVQLGAELAAIGPHNE